MSKSKRATAYTSEMKFKNHLESIKVTMMDYPTMERLASYIPEFVSMTWMEEIDQIDMVLEDKEMTREDIVMEMFNWRTLPTALETVRLTMFCEGLDLTNVTHLIRHRLFSYSAQSTDPATMEGHDILENDAFLEHPDLLERSRKLCKESNELYKDALDRGLSFYDARHYQPRAKEAKYFVSGNIKDFIMLIRTRLGRTNQPTSDNILAMRMRQAILKVYPFLRNQLNIESPQMHYINAINEKFNLNTYPPDALHRKVLEEKGIDWSNAKFNHDKARDEYSTNDKFEALVEKIDNES